MLQDARSFAGTIVDSDHKVVLTKIDFGKRNLAFKRPKTNKYNYNCSRLSSSKEVQHEYQQKMSNIIEDKLNNPSNSPVENFQTLVKCVKQTAQEVVGKQLPASKKCVTNDPEVVALSERRHKLRLQLNCNKSEDRVTLRSEINLLKNKIKKRLKVIHNQEANALADEINSTDDSRRMFEAMRQLSNYRKTTNNVHVHDDDGNTLGNDTSKAKVLGKWFESQFTSEEDAALATFDGAPSPLNNPISVNEVSRAAKKLKNGRACGPDNIPNELLKYAGESYSTAYASIINKCFETHTVIDELGQGTITPLQKPGKPKGPKESLRPLTLSNGARKLLSLITLHRIGDKIDDAIPYPIPKIKVNAI